MSGHRGGQKSAMANMTKGQKVGVTIAVFVVVSVVYYLVAPKPSASTPAAAASPVAVQTSAPAAKPTPAPKPSNAAPEPTFVYPGDPQCSITYRDRGDGSMSWTATVTVAGSLITHAGDSAGNLYSHDTQVQAGPNAFAAPVPLSSITDIGGNLTTSSGTSYGCSVAPTK